MVDKYKTDKKGNVLGIVGICIGWALPIVGVILGIIALSRGEDTPALGIIAIIESIVVWVIVAMMLMA